MSQCPAFVRDFGMMLQIMVIIEFNVAEMKLHMYIIEVYSSCTTALYRR